MAVVSPRRRAVVSPRRRAVASRRRRRLLAASRPAPFLAVVGLVAAGCGSPWEPPLEELPRALSPVERALVASANQFGLPLFARIAGADPGGNVVFSPLSAYLALGMAANGADGETLAAMRDVLAQSGLSEDEANDAYRSLTELLLGLDLSVELEIANSLWYREGFPVRREFVELSRRFFDAVVAELDFADPGAPGTINGWVEEATRGRIRDLLDRIDPEEVVFLVNATYFRGRWQTAFDPSRTRPGTFRRPDGSAVAVPMMEREAEVRYAAGEEFQAVELPYGRGAFVMTLMLPPEGMTPAGIVAGIDAETWRGWMEGLRPARVVVQIPRFRLEWGKGLSEELKAMGMAVAFDQDRADFGRLAEEGALLPGNLYITRVQQEAFVDVDERGTEAAAATSVGIGVTSAPPTFRADRPFLFAIRERFSGTVLFVGQVADPTSG